LQESLQALHRVWRAEAYSQGIFKEPYDIKDKHSKIGSNFFDYCGTNYFLNLKSFSGIINIPDDSQHPIAFHDFLTDIPYIIKEGNGGL